MKKELPKFFSSDGQARLPDGQVVLVILLLMAVILTIGLSIASRSVTDIKISQQTQEATRALWVAQAGLEKAIKANLGTAGEEMLGDIPYNVSKTALGGGGEFVYPGKISADDTKTFWLVGHNSSGQIDESEKYQGSKLTVYWGEGLVTPALEITYIYKDNAGKFYFVRYAFDPQSRTPPTQFSSPGGGGVVAGRSFAFSGEINTPGNIPYLLKLKLLYNDVPAPIGLKSQNDTFVFPTQGNCFEATAIIPESNITKRLNECRLWQATPQIFDYVLFSAGSL